MQNREQHIFDRLEEIRQAQARAMARFEQTKTRLALSEAKVRSMRESQASTSSSPGNEQEIAFQLSSSAAAPASAPAGPIHPTEEVQQARKMAQATEESIRLAARHALLISTHASSPQATEPDSESRPEDTESRPEDTLLGEDSSRSPAANQTDEETAPPRQDRNLLILLPDPLATDAPVQAQEMQEDEETSKRPALQHPLEPQ